MKQRGSRACLAAIAILPFLLVPASASAGTINVASAGAPRQQAGVLEAWSFQFTTQSDVSGEGEVRVVFPPGFQLMDDPPATCRFLGPGTLQYASSFAIGREVLCILGATDTLPAGSDVRIEITGVRNPTTAQTTGPFLIQTRDRNDTVIDESGTLTELISAHPLSGVPDHRNPDRVVGAVTTHSFTFTLFNGWAQNGFLELTFPEGYAFDAAGPGTTVATFTRGGTGYFTTPTIEGRTLFLQRQGGQPLYGGTQVSVNVTQVRNPMASGVTGPFTVTTSNGTRADHDTGQTPGDAIVSALSARTSDVVDETGGVREADGRAPALGILGVLVALAVAVTARRR